MKKQDMFELIEYGLKKQDDNFRMKVQSILNEEKAAGRRANVELLERFLDIRVTRFLEKSQGYFTETVNEQMIKEFLYVKEPARTLDDLELACTVKNIITELVEEQKQAMKLEAHGLSPRSRILLEGPPGNGKTCLAEALAHALELPFLVARQEQVITSLLGKTAKNLYTLFSYAVKQPCVLFFDEFDALGGKRQTSPDSGELSRVVNSLLTEMDALPSYVVFVVATNRGDMLDNALFRRFDISLTLPMPDVSGLTRYYKRYMENHHLELPVKPEVLAEETMPCSYANAEKLLVMLHRKIVLHGKEHLNFNDELEQWEITRKG